MARQLSQKDVQQLHDKVFQAAKHNQPDVIRACLLSLHPDLVKDILLRHSWHCQDEVTPLAVATALGHVEVAELLVNEHYADPPQEIVELRKRHNALACAAYHGHLDIVKLLVRKGCSMSAAERGDTPAFAACRGGHLDVLKYLVERGADVNDCSPRNGTTCLIVASLMGNLELVKYLLSEDANVNEQDKYNRTALHWAAKCDRSRIVALLLQHGANLSRDCKGHSPLLEAALQGCKESLHNILQFKEVSQMERINAFQLLGANLATRNFNEAVKYMSLAMELRQQSPKAVLHKPNSPLPTLSHLQESQTMEELKARQSDQFLFCLECLAAGTRILGPADEETMHLYFQFYEHFQFTGKDREATAVFLHGFENSAASISDWQIEEVASNFAAMMKEGRSGLFPDIYRVMEVLSMEIEKKEKLADYDHSFKVRIFLNYLLLALSVARGQEEGRQLQKLTERFLCLECSSGVVLKAVNCVMEEPDGFDEIDLHYDLLVQFLLQLGADVHFKDTKKNTALHALADLSNEDDDPSDLLSKTAQVLVKAGALPGVQNIERKTPLDLAGPWLAAELRKFYPVSLKSLSSTAVVNCNITYATEVPKDLGEFVDKH